MNRLKLCAKQEQPKDPWLNQIIEVINTDSKLYAYRGEVTNLKNNKYTLTLDAQPYEDPDKKHPLYIPADKMFKWVRILPPEGE